MITHVDPTDIARTDRHCCETSLHLLARQRMIAREQRGWFRSDWVDAAFVHLEVDPDALQRITPFEIDRFHGRAFVSLVAFSMRRFRPRFTGSIGAACMAIAAQHELLNVRTYVRHRGEPGICFLTEWIPNPLSVLLGPRTYGLPYRLATLKYQMNEQATAMNVDVSAADAQHRLVFRSEAVRDAAPFVARAGSLDEFLVERYTAFTRGHPRGRAIKFRVWHQPWELKAASVAIEDRSLLTLTDPGLSEAKFVGGHLSRGVTDVWIGRPRRC